MHIRADESMGERPNPAAMFRALADSTRLRIVHLLKDGPLCVGDLVTVLAVPQPTASRHLAYLRRVGLVVDERRGTWSFYRLAGATASFHAKLLECVGAADEIVAQTRLDDAALRSLRHKGGCCPQHQRATKRSNHVRRG